MSNKITLVVSVWLKNADIEAFEAFERRIAKIQARHGGRIERAIRLEAPGDNLPFEIHVVTFDSPAKLADYRADPEMKTLAAERDALIAKTVIAEGRDIEPYRPPDN